MLPWILHFFTRCRTNFDVVNVSAASSLSEGDVLKGLCDEWLIMWLLQLDLYVRNEKSSGHEIRTTLIKT